MNNPRQTPMLLQVFSSHSVLEVTQYEAVCTFLESPSYAKLKQAVHMIDSEVELCRSLSISQVECIKYLIRDWGYSHIKQQITIRQKKELFTINNKKQACGHFIQAIDFAKRNPKENVLIMQFGLTLLIHSALKISETKPKIEALEQLLSSIYRVEKPKVYTYTKNLNYLIGINLVLLILIIMNHNAI